MGRRQCRRFGSRFPNYFYPGGSPRHAALVHFASDSSTGGGPPLGLCCHFLSWAGGRLVGGGSACTESGLFSAPAGGFADAFPEPGSGALRDRMGTFSRPAGYAGWRCYSSHVATGRGWSGYLVPRAAFLKDIGKTDRKWGHFLSPPGPKGGHCGHLPPAE